VRYEMCGDVNVYGGGVDDLGDLEQTNGVRVMS